MVMEKVFESVTVYHTQTGNAYRKGRLSTEDFPVLTSLDLLLLILKTLFTFFTKQVTLIRRLIVLSLPFQFVFPDINMSKFTIYLS